LGKERAEKKERGLGGHRWVQSIIKKKRKGGERPEQKRKLKAET